MTMLPPIPGRDAHPRERLAFALLCFLVGAYVVHAGYAVASERHLYGDAAWFLAHVASVGRVFPMTVDFLREWYCTRAVAMWITEGPSVLALRLGLDDVAVLSRVFGATLFGVKAISLVVCYRLLPAGRKLLFVFPALALFAGTINSDVYIVSEIHVAVALAWPILIALQGRALRGGLAFAAWATVVALTALVHESFAFFAALMLGALVRRWWQDGRPADVRRLVLAALLGFVVVVNAAAIVFPRSATQKAAFLDGVRLLLREDLGGMRSLHVGSLVSLLATLAVLALAFLPRRARVPGGAALVAVLCLVLAAAPLTHFVRFYAQRVRFEEAARDRAFSGLVVPLLLMGAFLVVQELRWEPFVRRGAAAAALVAALAVGQVTWQLAATRVWRTAVEDLRSRLATSAGALSCPSGPDASPRRVLADRVLCDWWVTPLSIVLSPGGRVRAVVFSTRAAFRPFENALPDLACVRHDFSEYRAAVAVGRW